MTEDCILCTQCMQACPENNVLKLQFFNKNIFISSRDYFIKKLRWSIHIHQINLQMNDKLNFIDERQKDAMRKYCKKLRRVFTGNRNT
mgnify:CR=1 FL=1